MPDTTAPEREPSGSLATVEDRLLARTDDLAPSGMGGQLIGGSPEREFTVVARTQKALIWRRFRQHKLAMASLVLLLLVVIFAFVGQKVWHYSYMQTTDDTSVSPNGRHPFGTDNLGHDLMAQVMRGTGRSLEIAAFVAATCTIVGATYGLIAGYYGGRVDSAMMRVVDLWLTFPLLAVAAVLGFKFQSVGWLKGWFGTAMVLAVLSWAPIARVIRGVVLSLREREFIEAATAMGATPRRIIVRHLLPNAAGPIIVNATIYLSVSILAETALSFLGFGVQPPDTSLGLLISQNQTAVDTRPWLFYFPGLFIILIALTVNFIGDGLRDALDPQQNRVRA